MASGIENPSTSAPRAHLRIVVTGATGFVGRLLVPRLQSAGAHLLLVGRDPAKLAQLFPECIRCDYSELSARGANFDMLLHLATLNNNQACSREMFRQVNVDFLIQTAEIARRAKIPTFVDISSIQTLEQAEGKSLYADTKREGSALLSKMDGIEIRTLLLPLVHANHTYAGKLAKLNRLPRWLSRLLFVCLSALKPTLHAHQLADHILAGASGGVITTGQSKNTVYRILSRTIDLGFAFSVLVVLWWIILIAWIVVKIDSAGPGLFIQTRVGREQSVFPCFKLRTMASDTPDVGTHEVNAAVSVTRVGHFLRRSKIDELPQVFNLIRGDMSLVGPRPCLPVQAALIKERDARGVFSIRPGITGLAQVQDIDMSDPERLAKVDADYLARRSILLDIKLVLRTMLVGGIR